MGPLTEAFVIMTAGTLGIAILGFLPPFLRLVPMPADPERERQLYGDGEEEG